MNTSHDVVVAALSRAGDLGDVEVPALALQLMSANLADYSATVNQEVAALRQIIADREAELGAIRSRINELFAGPYMPTESAIIQAVFYPSKKELKNRMREA